MLFKIQGSATHILGSVHVLPTGLGLPDWISNLAATCRRLVIEHTEHITIPLELPGDQNLTEFMSAEHYREIQRIWNALGIQMRLDRMPMWRVGLVINSAVVNHAKLSPVGIDKLIIGAAQLNPDTLESLDDVCRSLAQIPSDEFTRNIHYLKPGEVLSRLQDILHAWQMHDVTALEQLVAIGKERQPNSHKALLSDRNRNWIPKILSCQDDPAQTLIVVGILHLIGPDSVIDLLQRQGIAVERLV